MTAPRSLLQTLREEAIPIEDRADDYAPLLFRVGDARVVLIGEASHGTHDFYRERARITRHLVEERGFSAVAIEGDWPHALRVSRWVRGEEPGDADHALAGFQRFPTWMWRNREVLGFLNGLERFNARRPQGSPRVGFYGLDLYSLFTSMAEVIRYLESHDAEGARRARERYACFEQFHGEAQRYGHAATYGYIDPCEDEAVQQLLDLRRRAAPGRSPTEDDDERFFAEQNARLVRDAERYYRAMFRGGVESWNLRDLHMMDTLEALLGHLDREWERSRIVVWAHNSHVGDARETELGASGELNLGQLARERLREDAVIVGFTTYEGTVSAASDWDAEVERKWVRPALPGSWEEVLHEVGLERYLLSLDPGSTASEALRERRLHRAIGVIYRPETERHRHYVEASIGRQYDVVIHLEQTRAVEPLEPSGRWIRGEPPETFPSAL